MGAGLQLSDLDPDPSGRILCYAFDREAVLFLCSYFLKTKVVQLGVLIRLTRTKLITKFHGDLLLYILRSLHGFELIMLFREASQRSHLFLTLSKLMMEKSLLSKLFLKYALFLIKSFTMVFVHIMFASYDT